ncbi:MAG: extracellular solute-binding protein [Bacteriovorax sp.]|nr:extracellular solute-binding protein [Bacteriovorax sp.]
MRKTLIHLLVIVATFSSISSCTKKNEKEKVWIYTSLYKDTVNDLKVKMEKEFPNIDVQIYQAGSEEVAAKVQAEALAGKIQADILISSDRFWYEDMAAKGTLLAYKPKGTEKVEEHFKNTSGFYTAVSLPVMVMAYNSEAVTSAEAPKTFAELKDPKWKDKVSSGSPLASGTSFTTVAFLSKKYGWDYYSALRKNNFIAEGGNSGVIRRLQSKERPVGIVLLENLLRLTEKDPRIKLIVPEDGAVMQANVLAIVKKDGEQLASKKIADWMFAKVGQETMVQSFMYATMPGFAAPKGAPALNELLKNAQPWSQEFISEVMQSREKIKDQFSKIVF